MRLQPLEKASGPLTMEKSSIGDFIGKMNSEARKQDVKTEGIVFLADGIDSTMEIEHEWPVRGKLNDFLFGVAKHNKFYVYSAEQTVLLCSEQRFLELDALAGARQFRAKVMAGGQWQWPTKEMKTAIKNFLPLIQQWSDIAWDSNKEFVFESKPFSCMVVSEQPQEILLIEKRVEKEEKVLRHYLIPLKQANLIAEGFFDDNMTFIQFADEALNPSPFAK